MEFPQVDLPVDVIAWTEVTEDILNIYKQSCRLKACIFVLCIEGSISASINLSDVEVKQGDFVTLLPGTIIQIHEQKEKLRLGFIGFSADALSKINILQHSTNSFLTMSKYPILSLPPLVASYILDFFSLWAHLTTGPLPPDNKQVQYVLEEIFYGVNKLYLKYHQKEENLKSRKEAICRDLIQLIIENYTTERNAQFYADKLGLTLQYLSTTVKQITGKNLLDIIASAVLVDAKSKLKSTDMTVQEIAYSLNFQNASFFGKYFKRYVGMSPLEYKNN